VDPLSFQGSLLRTSTTTELSEQETTNRQGRLDYNLVPSPVTVKGAPGFLVGVVDAMPGFIRRSEFARALRTARLRVNPAQLRWSVNFVDNRTSRFAYRAPVALPSDSALRPLEGIVKTLRADAGIDLRPFNSLSLRANLTTNRDLQDYGDSTAVGRLLLRERRELAGLDVGFERQRTLTTGFNVTPVFTSWLRPRFIMSTSFTFNRDPNQRIPVRADGDSAGAFRAPETIGNSRRTEVGATFSLDRLVAGAVGDSSFVARIFRGIQPIDLSYSRDLRSTFDRVRFDPSLHYQLAFGWAGSFRSRNGILASSAGDATAISAGGAVRFPLGLMLRLSFRDQETLTWTLRATQHEQAQVISRSREWPSGSLAWTLSPRGGIRRVLSIVNASARYAETRTENVQPGLAGGEGSMAESRGTAVAPAVTLTWRGGIVTSLQYSTSTSDAVTSGNISRRDQADWNASVNFAFRMPRSLVRLPNEIRATLGYSTSTVAACLIQAGTDECVPVSESYRSTIDVRLDTGLSSQVRGGANFSYAITAQRHLSREFSQMVFSVFAEIFLVSGQLR
jgi:hypothetical protein